MPGSHNMGTRGTRNFNTVSIRKAHMWHDIPYSNSGKLGSNVDSCSGYELQELDDFILLLYMVDARTTMIADASKMSIPAAISTIQSGLLPGK